METGARVWISDSESEDAWLLCEIAKKTDSELVATHVDDSSRSITRNRTADTSIVKYQGVELANAPLSEEEKKEGRDDDLITLPHLHEPAILHAVNERFMLGKIYTWTGPVLIAVNPFQRLPLYTRELLQAYRQEGLLRSQGLLQKAPMGPHIYSIADRSYRQMMSTGRSGVKKSQAILISGESGAGKTESTKIVMLYLTTLGSDNEHAHAHENAGAAGTDTMERVLQSNPILEAFGNARTLRNDNSSRFGKFIELGFSRAGMLLGARVDTYLLEKVRLGFHASGERNYHIFYQLLRGATPEQQQKFHFYEGHTGGLELCNYFHYTGQGGAPHLREFTDEEGLAYTIKAMKRMAWSEDKVDTVLKLIAGLLHLGQMTFSTVDVNGEEAASIEQQSTLEYAAELIGVDQSLLQSALTQRIMEARGERMTLVLSPARALDARDALSKTIYGALFLWVVQQVNDNIMWPNDKDKTNSIGVLDIFGFECFAINSFEQLCINFTNEALQQQFNKFIFKMEQAEYEREQIEWQFIDFPDNQDCLDLIQSRPNGLLAMLDDECRLPKGSDRNWANRLYKEHLSTDKKVAEDENGRFFATAIQKSKAIFCVRHFAGKVAYTAETGFLEKNRDEIPLAAKNLLENAPNQLIRDIYSIQLRESEVTSTSSSGKSKTKSRTVGMQFKDQLLNLMAKVETTEPHYIRCLKPNDKAKPLMLVRARLTEQLRYGGVLEAVRVARMGYPVRLGHAEFFRRYRMVLPGNNAIPWSTGMDDSEHPATGNTSAQSLCIQLVDAALADAKIPFSEKYGSNTLANRIRRSMKAPEPMDFPRRDVQLGLSKVFLRKPPHDQLESHRTFHQNVSVTVVQTFIRTAQLRRAHLVSGHAVGIIQRWYRGCLGRAAWWKLKEQVSAALLNKVLRMWTQYSRFTRAKNGTVRLQGAIRGRNVRRSNAATRIQTQVRMVQKRRPYVALLSAIISLQCALRCRVARQVYGSLRAEQKDIGKLKRNNEQLKNEMASLRAMLKAQAESQANNAGHAEALQSKENDLKVLEGRVKVLEQMLAAEKEKVSQLEKQIQVKDAESQSAMDVLEEKLNQAIGDRDAALEARDSARSAATAASAAAAASASISAQMVQQMSPPSSPRRVSTMTTTTPQAAALQPEPTIVAIPPPPDLSDNNDLPLPPKSPRSPVANAAAAIVTNAAAAIGLVNASTATAATKTVTVSAEDAAALAQFEAHIARLEQELKKERLAHSTAQKEVKQLKTQLSSGSNTNGDAGPAKGLRNSMRFMKERINSAVNVTTTPPPNNSKDASGSSSLRFLLVIFVLHLSAMISSAIFLHKRSVARLSLLKYAASVAIADDDNDVDDDYDYDDVFSQLVANDAAATADGSSSSFSMFPDSFVHHHYHT